MVWSGTLYSIPPFAAACISALLIWKAWPHRDRRITTPFIALMAAIGLWSTAYGIQLSNASLTGQLFWRRITGTAAILTPTIWFVLTSTYADEEHWLTRRSLGILAMFPLSYTVLIWTNSIHGLVWRDAALVGTTPPLLKLTLGPAYFGYVSVAYVLVLVGILQLLRVFLSSSELYRRQAGLLAAGAVVPLLANVAFTFGIDLVPQLELTTFSFTLTGVVFGAALFQFDLLDLTPVARQQLIDDLGIGYLVADTDDRVVDYNETARRVLPNHIEVGMNAADLFSVENVVDVDGLVSATTIDGQRRFHDFQVSPLCGREDRLVGRLVGIRDITERREYEQRLEVTNRLLRHNLRNEMNKITGWADVAEQNADERARDALARIRSVATSVSDLSEQAKQIQTTLDRSGEELVAVDVADILSSIVADVRADWPDAEITLSAPNHLDVLAPNEALLETACRNLVENALEHNDAADPRVDISLQQVRDSRTVELRIADNGPGIPDMERETLLRGAETPLQHGSGLGLWLVNWIVSAARGDLTFRENDPRGSVVVVRLDPAATASDAGAETSGTETGGVSTDVGID